MKKVLAEISEALSRIDDPSLVQGLLNQLLTQSEVKRLALRWELSKELLLGKSQRRIAEDLGVSLCNITRGSRELKKSKSVLKKVLEKSLAGRGKRGRS